MTRSSTGSAVASCMISRVPCMARLHPIKRIVPPIALRSNLPSRMGQQTPKPSGARRIHPARAGCRQMGGKPGARLSSEHLPGLTAHCALFLVAAVEVPLFAKPHLQAYPNEFVFRFNRRFYQLTAANSVFAISVLGSFRKRGGTASGCGRMPESTGHRGATATGRYREQSGHPGLPRPCAGSPSEPGCETISIADPWPAFFSKFLLYILVCQQNRIRKDRVEAVVPEISRSFGIVIRMFAEPGAPHHTPHRRKPPAKGAETR